MENASELDLALFALVLLDVGLVAGVAGAVKAVFDARRKLGRELASERSGRASRFLLVAAIAATFAAAVVHASELPMFVVASSLALSGALVLVAPHAFDATLGEEGVRCGWHARRFEELEEWRLAGQHLRWKLFGVWRACPVPPERAEELRAKLVRACAERESRFAG